MKKFLPKLKKILLVPLLFLILSFSFSSYVRPVFAADPVASEGAWVRDADVTFAGKVASRSGQLLDWTLFSYNWSSVSGTDNPLAKFWVLIRNIVYAFMLLFVLASAFILIITRGRNFTIVKFIPRFLGIILLVTFSFAIVQFIYQICDAIQGFFLTNQSGKIISQKDLLYVGFTYPDFTGYRRFGLPFDESVFISLLLVKLTALTYYVMVGILLLRKIILWFFIIISPVFPLLLFYSPIRNTAKIWVGEFFRWLLYAPLFAIFLSGLVRMWGVSTTTSSGIPLAFKFSNLIEYPTAISILIGGPGQLVNLSNSVNNRDTFALYVVALLMLWVVIILPFLLLQIFLDYFHEFSFSENTFIKQILSGGSNVVTRITNGPKPPPPPPAPVPTGIAKPMPFTPAKIEIPQVQTTGLARNIGQTQNVPLYQTSGIQQAVKNYSQITNLTNLSVPTMRDIARYETSLISRDTSSHQEIARVHETLESIAQPSQVAVSTQKERFSQINEKLVQEARLGNPLATSILQAASSVTKISVSDIQKSSVENVRKQESEKLMQVFRNVNNLEQVSSAADREKLQTVKTELTKAQERGDPLAASILSASQKGESVIGDDFKERLIEAKEKGNQLAVSVLTAAGITEFQPSVEQMERKETEKLTQVFSNMTSLDKVSSFREKEKLSQFKTLLEMGKENGNPLAASILSVSESGKLQVTDELKEQIWMAKERGDPLASNILETAGLTELHFSEAHVKKKESEKLKEIFTNINSIEKITSFPEKQKLSKIKEELLSAKERGDPLASAIFSMTEAGKIEITEELKKRLMEARQKGNQLAVSVMNEAGIKEAPSAPASPSFPLANRVQNVSIEDYESVKKIWQENYLKLEPPKNIEGKQRNRKEWVHDDIVKISDTINLLASANAQNVTRGMDTVGSILPFLLIGGFTQSEVVAYLKAKLEAAKQVEENLSKKQEEEETMLDTRTTKTEKPKEMEMEAEKNPGEDIKEKTDGNKT